MNTYFSMIKKYVERQFNDSIVIGERCFCIFRNNKYDIRVFLTSIFINHNPFYVEIKLDRVVIRIKKESINLDRFIAKHNGSKRKVSDDDLVEVKDILIRLNTYKSVLEKIRQYIVIP